MPLIFDKYFGNTRLLLWRIDETEEQLSEQVTNGDLCSAERFKNQKRKLEHLASRAALRVAVPDGEVEYDNVGAPFVAGESRRISISHTNFMCAIVISENRCAVDIENADRDFERVSNKYIAEEERFICESLGNDGYGIMWCAKEALYKYSEKKELDLIRDIRIIDVSHENAEFKTIYGSIKGCDAIKVKILKIADYIISLI